MGIGKLLSLWVVATGCVSQTICFAYGATDIFVDKYGTSYDFDDDIIVHDNVDIVFDNIHTKRSIVIDNHGYIAGNINVCPGCRLFIKNSGDLDASFNLNPGAQLIQMITNSNEITDIGVSSNFNILVHDGADVSLGSVMAVGHNADKITFENVTLRVDSIPLAQLSSLPDIELRGDVHIVLGELDNVRNGTVIMSNVTLDGTLSFYSEHLSNIYALNGRFENDSVYIELVRETDYARIFQNKTGEFLNNLRGLYPDDPLLVAMDAAPDIDSLYSVMARSVQLHPINLMNPIRTYMGLRDIDFEPHGNEVSATARAVISSDYYINGTNISLGVGISDNWHVSGTIGIGRMEYTDDINIFAADIYDGRLEIGYDNGHIVNRASVSGAITKFDVGPVLSGNDTIYNPTGMTLHTMYEAGYRFNLLSNVEFIPVVGINGDIVRVANESDSEIGGVFGADMIISNNYVVMDYDYIVRVRANTNHDIAGAFGIRMWSNGDDMGGDISIGVMRDEFATSYNVSVALRVAF